MNHKANHYMSMALEQAKIALIEGELPVGAVIVKDNTVIARAYNKTKSLNNPTAHAEFLAINNALKILNTNRLKNCELFITLEPCHMCTGAIVLSKVDKVFFGAKNQKKGALISKNTSVFSEYCNHVPKVYGYIEHIKCSELLDIFFKYKR